MVVSLLLSNIFKSVINNFKKNKNIEQLKTNSYNTMMQINWNTIVTTYIKKFNKINWKTKIIQSYYHPGGDAFKFQDEKINFN